MKKPMMFAAWIAGLVASCGFALSAGSASAITIRTGTVTTDAQFQNLVATGLFDEDWVIESRAGNKANNGDWELGIWEHNDVTHNNQIRQTEQNAWTNGQTVDFSVAYNGSGLTYTVGSKILNYTFANETVKDLLFRVKTTDANNSIALQNLQLNGENIGNLIAGGTANDTKYLHVTDFTTPFTITGTQTFSWNPTSTYARSSHLAYQIKAGVFEETQVPEPGITGSLLALAGVGSLLLRRKGL